MSSPLNIVSNVSSVNFESQYCTYFVFSYNWTSRYVMARLAYFGVNSQYSPRYLLVGIFLENE